MKELKSALIGSLSPQVFFAACLFCLIGWILFKVVTAAKATAPENKFDFRFWWGDNKKELVYKLVWTFVLVRFAPELFKTFAPDIYANISGMDGMWIYFLVGICASWVINKLANLAPKQ